jgi:hypothetical protein
MTLHWLKAYPTYIHFEAFWEVSPQTLALQLKNYTKAIQALKEKKIRWFEEGELDDDDFFIVSVDGVHCKIQEV